VRTYYTLQPNSPELIALYRASDVFALPTEAEPFGIAAAEACAAGIALITTSVGGLADIVADDENGFIVPPRDPAALRALLLLLAEDPARRVQMGRAARARAERSFDAEANAARVVGHLRAAAGEPPIKAAARALPGPPGRGGRGR
jgi:glycosyltransferase involved in cell wall biosynthesis